ncbi:MAG: 1-acyl-sn-glycerol-3-phosphate acyltransferase [Clostridiaceae bacterium]|nr:1-acyl-sn-glycerol-3-phosphate acyltransferase [Clostridiaceae bacterium]
MKSRQYYYSKWFNKFLKSTFGLYLKKRFKVNIYNKKIQNIKPPYLVIGNHVGVWDPFLMSIGISDPIYFVISDSHFRNFWLRQVLKLVGGIPKSKQLADSGTIRAILSIIKRKGVIGLYPEGARNWDLKNVPVIYSTAKLIKSLKIPVISTVMQGAGLTRPRWARSSRTGMINMNYDILLKPEEIKIMDVDAIYQKVVDGINMNEYEWQKKNMIPFKGNNLAEYLDLFLVVCPKCKSLCSLYSHGDFFTCRDCSYTVKYDEYGFLKTEGEKFFDSPQTWSEWQNDYLYKLFSKEEFKSGKAPLFTDTDTKLFTGRRRGKLRKYNWLGKVELYFDRFEFKPEKGDMYTFPLDEISGMNTQNNNKFEFYYKNTLYRFKFTTQHKSIYKYELAINIIDRIKSDASPN